MKIETTEYQKNKVQERNEDIVMYNKKTQKIFQRTREQEENKNWHLFW